MNSSDSSFTRVLATLICSFALLPHGIHAATLANPDHWILGSENAGGASFNVSVNPDNAGFGGTTGANGPVSETFSDGIIDYRFFRTDPTQAGNIISYADGGEGRISGATTATGTNNSDSFAKVWTVTNPGVNFSNTPADFTSATMARTANATGSIDISGLAEGALYFFYGAYRNTPRFNITMSGAGQPDVILNNAGGQDFANNNEMYATTITFADAADYDTITYDFAIIQEPTNNGRGRLGGIVLTAPQVIPEPSRVLLFSAALLLLLARRRR